MHPELHRGMKSFVKVFDYVVLEMLDQIDLDLSISILPEDVSEAWQLYKEKSLVIRLSMSLSQYTDSNERPKVKVLHPSSKYGFHAGFQIKSIVESFLDAYWKPCSSEVSSCSKINYRLKKSYLSSTTNKTLPSDTKCTNKGDNIEVCTMSKTGKENTISIDENEGCKIHVLDLVSCPTNEGGLGKEQKDHSINFNDEFVIPKTSIESSDNGRNSRTVEDDKTRGELLQPVFSQIKFLMPRSELTLPPSMDGGFLVKLYNYV